MAGICSEELIVLHQITFENAFRREGYRQLVFAGLGMLQLIIIYSIRNWAWPSLSNLKMFVSPCKRA